MHRDLTGNCLGLCLLLALIAPLWPAPGGSAREAHRSGAPATARKQATTAKSVAGQPGAANSANNPAGAGKPAAPGPSTQNQAPADAGTGGDNPLFFYAFLEGKRDFPVGPAEEFLSDKPFFREAIERARHGEGRFVLAPMLQWYCWANEPKPFGQALAFCLLATLVTWTVFPNWMVAAQDACRERFATSLGTGILCALVAAVSVRVLFATQIGWALGVGLMGVIQVALLAGLAIVVSLAGHAIGVYLKLDRWPVLNNHQSGSRLVEFLIGALICAILVQIPGIGRLPQIGTRLVILLALVGVGGLYRTRITRASEG